ncbi:MAG: YfhO family protein [Acidobacteriota bacterium]
MLSLWAPGFRRIRAHSEPAPGVSSPSRREIALVSLLLVLISCMALGANLFRGEVVAPMDLLLSGQGWPEELHTEEALDGNKADVLDAWIPRWLYVKSRLREGAIPLWNPFVSGGQPALPLLFDSYLSPSFLIFLLLGNGLGYSLALLVRLFIAGLGAFLLCRLEFSTQAALLGAVTFMLCGFNLSWLMWPQVATSCWIPWVIWSFVRLMRNPNRREVGVLAILTALMLFGGFPALAGYTLYLLALLSLWMILSRPGRSLRGGLRPAFWAVAGVSLGFLLTAFQLLPSVEYLSTVDLSWRQASSVPIDKLPFLLFPFFKGYHPHPEYTGYVGWIAMLLVPLALLQRRRRGPLSSLFWVGVAALSLVLIYGFPPFIARIVYHLPVFNLNPNGRLFVIFGLAMAVLAAAGYTFLQKILTPSRRWILLAAPLLILLQAGDLIRVGWAQNAVVADSKFFPETPLLRYLQKQTGPGQSAVLTYDTLRFPGILTAYGIEDWFAHTHRLPQERTILDCVVRNPWVTPTAAQIHAEDIRLDSPCFDLFSIRFIVSGTPTIVGQWRTNEVSQLQPGETALQRFTLDKRSRIAGARFKTATGGRSVPAGALRLTLLDGDRRTLSASVDASGPISDNGWTEFSFPTRDLDPGQYFLRLEVTGNSPHGGVYLWSMATSDSLTGGSLLLEGKPAGVAAFGLLGADLEASASTWKRRDFGRVRVYERDNPSPGAFLSESFKPTRGDQLSHDGIRLLRYSPERAVYQVETDRPEWMVRSMRVWPGWHVYVDGRPVETKPFLDLMPAVRIPAGVSEVEYRYQPASWRIGWILSLAAVAILLACILRSGDRRLGDGREAGAKSTTPPQR